jgi:hypothetical protein
MSSHLCLRTLPAFALAVLAGDVGALAPFSPASFVTVLDREILEFDRTGLLLQKFPIPVAVEPTHYTHLPRDLVFDERGRLHVYNGGIPPYLSTLDPETGLWEHRTHPEWTGSLGAIAAFGSHVFVTDIPALGTASGIIRFDLDTGESERFAETYLQPGPGGGIAATLFMDLALGGDGLLYGLNVAGSRRTIESYEPSSLEFIRSVEVGLGDSTQAIAVGVDGTIYALHRDRAMRVISPDGSSTWVDTPYAHQGDLHIEPDGSFVFVSEWVTFSIVTVDRELTRFESVPLYRSGGSGASSMFVTTSATRPISLDIRPRSRGNSVRPQSQGLLPVAILGAPDFDVRSVDPATLAFGPDGAAPVHPRAGRLRDVNRDGYRDRSFAFRISQTGIRAGDRDACLSGWLSNGLRFGGCDGVRTVPRHPPGPEVLGMVSDRATSSVVLFDARSDHVLASVTTATSTIGLGECLISSEQVGYVADGGWAWVVDLRAGALAPGINPISTTGSDLSFSPDQRYLVSCGGTSPNISVVELSTRTRTSTLRIRGASCVAAEVCADGSVLASSGAAVQRLVLDEAGVLTDTGELLLLTPAQRVLCAPDARSGVGLLSNPGRLASFSFPPLARLHEIATASILVSGGFGPLGNVYVRSTDGSSSYEDGSVEAFEYDAGQGAFGNRVLSIPVDGTRGLGIPGQLALHPDGSRFYVTERIRSEDALPALSVFDSESGALLRTLRHREIVVPTGVCVTQESLDTD